MVELAARLASGDVVLGTFIKTPHPHVVEVLATTGLDCLCLDAEHAPFDRRDIDGCSLAARSGGMPVLVRTQSAAPELILNALDCGADGVLVPHIRNAAEARALATCARYGRGGRGYAGSSRAAGYGLTPIPEHLAETARRTVVIAQIEDVEAVDAIDAISAIEGIDALFVGRIDLTIALGCDDPDDAKVIDAVDRIVASCVAAKRPVGMFVARVSDVGMWREKGVRLFLLQSDHAFLRSGAAALRQSAGLSVVNHLPV